MLKKGAVIGEKTHLRARIAPLLGEGRRILLEWHRRGQNNAVLYQKGTFAGGKAPI